MRNLRFKIAIHNCFDKFSGRFLAIVLAFLAGTVSPLASVSAQSVLFDFDNAPLSTSLPISLTASGITANLSATGQGYSIQNANVLGFVPAGFAGRIIYPNSVFLADLLISYNQIITDFSIMYSCQELGCDDAATMRVTAYKYGNLVGTATKTAGVPGTWPVDTLSCTFTTGFDSVVVHYDSPPPTCQDYGVIYLADNMLVTPLSSSLNSAPQLFSRVTVNPNPVSQSAILTFSLYKSEKVDITLNDIAGRLIVNLFDSQLGAGEHQINLDFANEKIGNGIYFLNLNVHDYTQSYKIVIAK